MPRRRNVPQVRVFPTRMNMQRLAVFLDVVVAAWPESRDLEKAPTVSGNRIGGLLGRLPAPQTVEANALARRRLFMKCLVEIPNCLDAGGQRRIDRVGCKSASRARHQNRHRQNREQRRASIPLHGGLTTSVTRMGRAGFAVGKELRK